MSGFSHALSAHKTGAEILVAIAQKRLTGELVWKHPNAGWKIFFAKGRPESCVPGTDPETRDQKCVIQGIRSLALSVQGSCVFTPMQREIDTSLGIDTLGQTLVALRQNLSEAIVEAVLEARATNVVVPLPVFEKFAGAVVHMGGARIEKPSPGQVLSAWIASLGQNALEAKRSVVTLLLLGAVSLDSSSADTQSPQKASDGQVAIGAPATSDGNMVQQPDPVLPADPNARQIALEIQTFHKKLPSLNHYQLLGVTPEAQGDAVRAAYFKFAKQWHSDKFSSEMLGPDFVRMAEEIFQAGVEANRVLSNEEEKKNYDYVEQRKAEGLPTDVETIFQAEGLFKRGQTLIRRGKAAAAEAPLREAVSLNKGEAEFWAYFGFAVFAAHGSDKRKEALDAINKALSMNDKMDSAHEFLGRIARIEGRIMDAEQELKKALQLNPKNEDAGRELRVLNMRAAKAEEPSKKKLPGFLGGLLKK